MRRRRVPIPKWSRSSSSRRNQTPKVCEFANFFSLFSLGNQFKGFCPQVDLRTERGRPLLLLLLLHPRGSSATIRCSFFSSFLTSFRPNNDDDESCQMSAALADSPLCAFPLRKSCVIRWAQHPSPSSSSFLCPQVTHFLRASDDAEAADLAPLVLSGQGQEGRRGGGRRRGRRRGGRRRRRLK